PTTHTHTLSLHDALPIWKTHATAAAGRVPTTERSVVVRLGPSSSSARLRPADRPAHLPWRRRNARRRPSCACRRTAGPIGWHTGDRKSTRLNSSHDQTSY